MQSEAVAWGWEKHNACVTLGLLLLNACVTLGLLLLSFQVRIPNSFRVVMSVQSEDSPICTL